MRPRYLWRIYISAVTLPDECTLESRAESYATSATQSPGASRRLCHARPHSRLFVGYASRVSVFLSETTGSDLNGKIIGVAALKDTGGLASLAWIEQNAPNQHTPWEIQQWSAYLNEHGPDGDVETLEFFTKRVGDISKTREDVKTWFDYLDLDDHVTFGGKA